MERFRITRGDLFSKGSTSDLKNALISSIENKIKNLKDDYILNVSENEYIQYLKQEYTYECPVMHFDDQYIETRKVMVGVEYLPSYWGAEDDYEATMIRLFIPFSGDKDLLYFCPMRFTLSGWSNFNVSSGAIYVDILALNKDGDRIKNDIAHQVSTIRDMMGYLNTDLCSLNRDLENAITQSFHNRKENIRKSQDFISSLGLPLKESRSKSQTYSIPTVKRTFEEPKAPTTSGTADRLAPTMDESTYKSILSSIENYGKTLEQHPQTTTGKSEEDIRALFLANLSSTFSSISATGETFNNKGKTDIMLRMGNDILFIAECKIWKGGKAFQSAISQLLSYLTWRNTKTALIMFVRETSMETVLSSIAENITTHGLYLSTVNTTTNGTGSYKFFMNVDKNKTVDLSILVFQIG